ncbi:transporter substrate-binding domain-containing protein [Ancylobacter sp. G4_0304]|uniref:transporter substrate-binding domain-containing protein n=1 Tax=Ancylobacter sp. G4_0304 TaxID=3114289 RepID=UPI0039C5FA0A
MKKLMLALALPFALAATMGLAPAFAQEPMKVTIATEGSSPPWNSTDSTGKLIGFDVDLGYELCRRMGATCTFVAQDWDGIIPALTVGKYDAIMGGMSITEKRKKTIDFSTPYAVGFNQIVMRKGLGLPPTDAKAKLNLTQMDASKQATIDTLRTALSGRTLGVLRSSNSEVVVNELFGKVATIRSYDTNENMTMDVAAGRVDGTLADFFVLKTFLESKDGDVAEFYGPMLNGGPWGPGAGIGIRKTDPQLKAAFDKAIASANEDGAIKALTEKWFGMDMSPPK